MVFLGFFIIGIFGPVKLNKWDFVYHPTTVRHTDRCSWLISQHHNGPRIMSHSKYTRPFRRGLIIVGDCGVPTYSKWSINCPNDLYTSPDMLPTSTDIYLDAASILAESLLNDWLKTIKHSAADVTNRFYTVRSESTVERRIFSADEHEQQSPRQPVSTWKAGKFAFCDETILILIQWLGRSRCDPTACQPSLHNSVHISKLWGKWDVVSWWQTSENIDCSCKGGYDCYTHVLQDNLDLRLQRRPGSASRTGSGSPHWLQRAISMRSYCTDGKIVRLLRITSIDTWGESM